LEGLESAKGLVLQDVEVVAVQAKVLQLGQLAERSRTDLRQAVLGEVDGFERKAAAAKVGRPEAEVGDVLSVGKPVSFFVADAAARLALACTREY